MLDSVANVPPLNIGSECRTFSEDVTNPCCYYFRVRNQIEYFGDDPLKTSYNTWFTTPIIPVSTISQSVGASAIGVYHLSFGGERAVPFQQAVSVSSREACNSVPM